MRDFHFIFEDAPSAPCATSPIAEVFAWSVWRAMQLCVKDIVFEEREDGLLVSYLDYSKSRSRRGDYKRIARFPHLRGAPLKEFPTKATGVASDGEARWNVRVWTCHKMAGNEFRSCAVVRFIAPPRAN